MNDPLRRELVAYFDRVVGRPPAGAGGRVMDRVRERASERQRRVHPLAVVLAVLLSGVLLGSLWLAAHAGRQRPAPAVRSTIGVPAARSGASLVTDGVRGRLMMFGGSVARRVVSETWEWDGAHWARLEPAASPSPRRSAVAAYDAARKQVVLFGGQTGVGGGEVSDTWTWDGTTWIDHGTHTSPGPVFAPGSSMAFDPVSRTMLLHTGPPGAGQLWSWNGSRWSVLMWPSQPVFGGQLVPTAGHPLLVGQGAGGSPTVTWSWDGHFWSKLSPAVALPLWAEATSTYDQRSRRPVVRITVHPTLTPETWTWDGRSWARVDAATEPALPGASAAYDPVGRRMAMYGQPQPGEDQLWELQGAGGWTVLQGPPPSPSQLDVVTDPPSAVADALATEAGLRLRLFPTAVPAEMSATVHNVTVGPQHDPEYDVFYFDREHTRTFWLTAGATAPPPLSGSPRTIRGVDGVYRVFDEGSGQRGLQWQESGVTFTLQGFGVSEQDFFAFADSLAPY